MKTFKYFLTGFGVTVMILLALSGIGTPVQIPVIGTLAAFIGLLAPQ